MAHHSSNMAAMCVAMVTSKDITNQLVKSCTNTKHNILPTTHPVVLLSVQSLETHYSTMNNNGNVYIKYQL